MRRALIVVFGLLALAACTEETRTAQSETRPQQPLKTVNAGLSEINRTLSQAQYTRALLR